MSASSAFLRRLVVLISMLALVLMVSRSIPVIGVAPLESADILASLPVKVGKWIGQDLYYCQNEMCARTYHADALGKGSVCLHCGSVVDRVSVGEKTLLPPDTTVVRKAYRDLENREIVVSVVISGNDQRSIHRPQQCLPAQGFDITATRTLQASLEGRDCLVMTLVSSRRLSSGLELAYWFVGGGHETHDHIRRLAWMAWDSIVRGERVRWAYVSLQMAQTQGEEVAQTLSEFAGQLYPLIRSHKLDQ